MSNFDSYLDLYQDYLSLIDDKSKEKSSLNIRNEQIKYEQIECEQIECEQIENDKIENESIENEQIKNEQIVCEQIKNKEIKNKEIKHEKFLTNFKHKNEVGIKKLSDKKKLKINRKEICTNQFTCELLNNISTQKNIE